MTIINLKNPASPSWQAELTLGFVCRSNRTVLATRRQRGPLAVQRGFYPEGEARPIQVCHTYLLHPPGGIVGGDQLQINVTVATAAHAVLTTPGATKFYRTAGPTAQQEQMFTVQGGCLEWLPQENIFFPGAQVALTTTIYLDATAQYIGWEIHCLGRPAIHERFTPGQASFYTALYREQRPLILDKLSIRNEFDLQGATSLRGFPVVATLLATPATPNTLEVARAECDAKQLATQIGVTLFNGVLVVRALGDSTEEIVRWYRHLWHKIRPLINGHVAVIPRIWAC